jgi:U3 small nucleolar RNA-associated protein 12
MDHDFRDGEDQNDEVAAASKQTIATLTHGEKLMEALEVGLEDYELMLAFERDRKRNPKTAIPQRNPIFMALGNITAEQHVLRTLQKIPSPALNDALLVVPFSTLPVLFTFLSIFIQGRMQPQLAWRVTYFLLQAHTTQIVASKQMKAVLTSILTAYDAWQAEESRILGFNLAALEILGREVRDRELVDGYVGDTTVDGEDEDDLTKGKRKRAFNSIA